MHKVLQKFLTFLPELNKLPILYVTTFGCSPQKANLAFDNLWPAFKTEQCLAEVVYVFFWKAAHRKIYHVLSLKLVPPSINCLLNTSALLHTVYNYVCCVLLLMSKQHEDYTHHPIIHTYLSTPYYTDSQLQYIQENSHGCACLVSAGCNL